jgi:hypothetical protein
MKPAVLVLILCLAVSVLAAIHQMVCEQDISRTTRCDIGFGVPIVVLLAVACGVSGLALLAMSNSK